MNSTKGAVIGAVIAGILGAVIWAWIGYQFHIRIGYVAIGIGALVGLGAAMGAGGEADTNTGIMAAIIAVVAITFGRYAVYKFDIDDGIKRIVSTIDSHEVIKTIADEVITEQEDAGKKLVWPEGRSKDDWDDSSQLPPKIWDEANKRWTSLTPDQRQGKINSVRNTVAADMRAGRSPVPIPSFFENLSFFDFLYAFVAAAAAFKLGGGFD